jgi:glycosyltransferase involved in cell wall biosynthesis
VAGAVEFAGFVLDVRPYLASADVFAMPSLSEGLGVAALEAMATGKPVVATDAGGLPESVIHQETGLIVPAGKPQLLADALIILLQHPARARQMGEAGRARALAQYDRPRIVDRIIALYHEVLGGG